MTKRTQLILWIAVLSAGFIGAGNRVANLGIATGPTEVAADNFNSYANNDDLTVGSWANEGGFTINIYNGSCFVGNAANYAYYRHTATFNANQYSTATVAAGTNANHAWGVTVRQQTGSVNCYLLEFAVDTGVARLVKVNAGTRAVLQTSAAIYTAGDKLWLEATGTGSSTRLTAKHYTGGSWTTLWTSEDPGGTYIDGGAAGVAGIGNTGTPRLDDWSGGNL
jgi:hypothetical protein